MSVSLYYYQQKIPKKQDSKHTHQKKKEEDLLITTQLKNMEYNEKPQNDLKNLERYDEYPGWLWDPDKETWIPDSEHQDIQ
jgi:hypothetical protein